MKNIKLITIMFTMAIVGGIVSVSIFQKLNPAKIIVGQVENQPHLNSHFSNYTSSTANSNIADFRVAAKNSLESVVHVRSIIESKTNYYTDPWMEFLFGNGAYKQQSPRREGTGSGVIISKDGYIVTNNHVINNADKVEITLNNKKKYIASLVGTDPNTDIALLKVQADNLPQIAYANSDELEVGEWVLAVGNPYNLNNTVTAGIVSAKSRDINILNQGNKNAVSPIESFIQTDAAVNPGNSGGALVNIKGELVGINTAIQSTTGSYMGYSFAVPVNIVKKVILDLKDYGSVQRAFIGVSIQNINQELADQNNFEDLNGVYIAGLLEDGAAESAGIKKGDIIKEVEGKTVNNVPELQEQLSKFRPGDDVRINILRNDELKTFNVELKNQFGKTELSSIEISNSNSLYGAHFEPISEIDSENLSLNHGIKVINIKDGKLRRAGIKEGFIITKIDNQKIKTFSDFERLLNSKKGGVLIEGYYPNGNKHYYGVGL